MKLTLPEIKKRRDNYKKKNMIYLRYCFDDLLFTFFKNFFNEMQTPPENINTKKR